MSKVTPHIGTLIYKNGNFSPFLPAPIISGPELLADFDYRTPVTAYDFSSEYATDQWDMQDAVTMANSGTVGTETLANTGGYMQQQAVGLHNGTDYVSRYAWESTAVAANATYLTASGTDAGDSDSEDFCFRFVYRKIGAAASSDYMLEKRSAVGGWLLFTSAGGLTFYLDGASSVKQKAITDADAQGPGWHWVSGWYDSSAEMMYLKTSSAAEVSLSTAGVGSLTNTNPLLINKTYNAAGIGNAGMQVGYAGVCVGANSESMYDAAEADCILPGSDPTGLLTTQARASLVSGQVAEGSLAHFSDGTTPICYHSALSGLGLLSVGPITNLVPYSDIDTGATNNNITSTDDNADAPDGFKHATTLLATANDGYQARTCVTVASTAYTASVYIEESTVGLTGLVIMYDETNGAELGSQTWTGTSTPQDVSVSASTIAGGISTSVRVEVDTNTETAISYMWQLELGTGTFAKARTAGSAAAIAQSDYRATGNYVQEQTGEVAAVFVLAKLPASGETHYIFDTVTAADRRALYVDSAGALKFLVGNSAGGTVAEVTLGTVSIDTKYTAQCQWDDAAGLGGSSVRAKLNALSAVSGGTSFTDGAGFAAELSIGASAANANTAINGLIESVKCYDGQNAI